MTALDPNDDRHITAIHEAGHAVSEYHHRDSAPRLSIVPNAARGTAGGALSEEPNPHDKEAVVAHVVDLFAGFAAHVHFAPDDAERARDGAESDDATAARWLELLHDDERERAVAEEALRQRAGQLIATRWAAVLRVATDLVRFETLDPTEVELLIEIEDGSATAIDLERVRCMIGRHEGHRHESPTPI
ncbi:MAG: hypothetical protein R3F35_01705 [Myxococcota bacterium]